MHNPDGSPLPTAAWTPMPWNQGMDMTPALEALDAAVAANREAVRTLEGRIAALQSENLALTLAIQRIESP